MTSRRKIKKQKKGTHKVFLGILIACTVLILGVVAYATIAYFNVKNAVDETYSPFADTNTETVQSTEKKISDAQTLNILLLGTDTGSEGRTGQGRSDTMILMQVNPQTNETYMVSLERDIRTEIVGQGTIEKLNHAYAYGGEEMAIATIENLLDTKIDYYITINMAGLKSLVDSVGGVDVTNTLDFTYQDNHFAVGDIHLDGTQALAYSRMRKEDPEGDYGRQKRQRQVVEAIIKKSINFKTAFTYQKILKSLESNVKMNLTWDNLTSMQSTYTKALSNIKSDQLAGTGEMIDGVSYQIVSDEELARVRGIIKTNLEAS